jgi:hypothetical protein
VGGGHGAARAREALACSGSDLPDWVTD